MRAALTDAAKKEGVDDTPQAIFSFLIERVRNNLHIVSCMSPAGEAFHNRTRMYPGFVNCTTIDWFNEWPADALLEVADKYLDSLQLVGGEDNKLKPARAQMFALTHRSVFRHSATT